MSVNFSEPQNHRGCKTNICSIFFFGSENQIKDWFFKLWGLDQNQQPWELVSNAGSLRGHPRFIESATLEVEPSSLNSLPGDSDS